MASEVREHVAAAHEDTAPDVIDGQRASPHEAVDAHERHPQRSRQLAEGDEVHVGALEQRTSRRGGVSRHGRVVRVAK